MIETCTSFIQMTKGKITRIAFSKNNAFTFLRTIPISFHWHTTAGMGMLLVVIKHHTIPTLSKHTPTDMGLLWVVKHHHQDVKMAYDIQMIWIFWIPAPLSVYG